MASGPSTKKAGVDLLARRLTTFAIKKNIELCPWAEAVYGCDFPWWRSVRGLPDYRGRKFAYEARACDQWGCDRVLIPNVHEDRLLFDKVGTVGAGGNSGFQALNLAVQFGAKRVLLIGFDMTDRGGVHWYGRNIWAQAHNPTGSNFQRWVAAFTQAAPVLERMGVEVINASPVSALQCFPKRSLAEALEQWGLMQSEAA